MVVPSANRFSPFCGTFTPADSAVYQLERLPPETAPGALRRRVEALAHRIRDSAPRR